MRACILDAKVTVLNMLPTVIKGIVHPKIAFLSLITHLHFVPNQLQYLFFLSSTEHKRRYFEKHG